MEQMVTKMEQGKKIVTTATSSLFLTTTTKALNTKKAQEMSTSLGPQVFILLLTFLDIIYPFRQPPPNSTTMA